MKVHAAMLTEIGVADPEKTAQVVLMLMDGAPNSREHSLRRR